VQRAEWKSEGRDWTGQDLAEMAQKSGILSKKRGGNCRVCGYFPANII
jgi:hypothetical protein